MSPKIDAFLKKLLATFKVEAEEHLAAIATRLLELEQTPLADSLEAVFREVHSFKGAARSVDAADIVAVCQSMENVLAAVKRTELQTTPELFDLFHQAINGLKLLLSSLEGEKTSEERALVDMLVKGFDGALLGKAAPAAPAARLAPEAVPVKPGAAEARALAADTVRIATSKLDSILVQSEELISEKLKAGQRAVEVREARSLLARWQREWIRMQPSIRSLQQALEAGRRFAPADNRPDGEGGSNSAAAAAIAPGEDGARRSAQTLKVLEFLEWSRGMAGSLELKMGALNRTAEQDLRSLSTRIDGLLGDVKNALLLPFGSLLEIFPKLVRDLARDQAKGVEWSVQGEEIEVDRRILDELKDPLIHLVRNCIDHGIESPAVRGRQGKPPHGRIQAVVSQHETGKVEIAISDDGAGIDAAEVREAALKHGIVTPEQAEKLSDQEACWLIFQSGVSTSPIITDLSGRGLGLAIVREKVEKLGGFLGLETQPGSGTTFRISLPMTLATLRGILVRAGDRLFAIPSTYIERVLRVPREVVKTVENRQTIEWHGQPVSLVRLQDALQLELPAAPAAEKVSVAVINSGESRIAFEVDEILQEQEILVKSMGQQLVRVRNLAGATVLGNGRVVPILNIHELLKSAVKCSASRQASAALAPGAQAGKKTILVADDSVTSRTLLKSILEAAGYRVKTAVDGLEAYTSLKTENVDLVVSDVEMPRMTGFDLTAKIRQEKRLGDLPVVLVTGLESRENRERGIDAGADAYIVKGNFDQNNLLEAIRRLI